MTCTLNVKAFFLFFQSLENISLLYKKHSPLFRFPDAFYAWKHSPPPPPHISTRLSLSLYLGLHLNVNS